MRRSSTVRAALLAGATALGCGDDDCDKCRPLPRCATVVERSQSTVVYSYGPEDMLRIAVGEWSLRLESRRLDGLLRVQPVDPQPALPALVRYGTALQDDPEGDCAGIWQAVTVVIESVQTPNEAPRIVELRAEAALLRRLPDGSEAECVATALASADRSRPVDQLLFCANGIVWHREGEAWSPVGERQ